jgi:hypothetical protein
MNTHPGSSMRVSVHATEIVAAVVEILDSARPPTA